MHSPPAQYNQVMYPPARPPLYPQPQQFSNYQPDHYLASPISGPPTPTTVSPNSQQILLHKKGPVAKTLYTPAALRPTRNPNPKNASGLPNAPITPPSSLQNSLHSLDKNMPKQNVSSRRNTVDSAKSGLFLDRVISHAEDILQRDLGAPGYGRVMEFPTKNHWKPDSTTSVCADPLCYRQFTIFHRKHHCRRCGYIFCAMHSSNLIPLNQDADFHPYGNRVRSCDACWSDYSRWEIKREEMQAESQGIPNASALNLPFSPPVTSPQPLIGFSGEAAGRREEDGAVLPRQIPPFSEDPTAQMAASVPENHHWSTF